MRTTADGLSDCKRMIRTSLARCVEAKRSSIPLTWSLMANLIESWNQILEEEKKLKAQKETLRAEILQELEEKESLLPIITVEVPTDYFTKTGQQVDDFLSTRYPDWTVETTKLKNGDFTFTLKKMQKFTNAIMEIEGTDTALAKTVVEYSPEIDVETLMLEDPELFDRIFEQKVSWEINEEALEQEVIENPDIYATLRRHSKVKMPSIKILVKKVKDD
jgi:hypothetical protein